jgi:hypothetical protein
MEKLLEAVDELESAATYYALMFAHLTEPETPSGDALQQLIHALHGVRQYLANHSDEPIRPKPPTDLLEAARDTLALWNKYGLGDDPIESDPVHCRLTDAVRRYSGEEAW